MASLEVRAYVTADGRCPLNEWLSRLRDRTVPVLFSARVDRLAAGLRGDWKPVGAGVFELRIDHGPGYRLYCAQHGVTLLLLCAGDKATQQADIEKAHGYWKDYKERTRKRTVSRGGSSANRT